MGRELQFVVVLLFGCVDRVGSFCEGRGVFHVVRPFQLRYRVHVWIGSVVVVGIVEDRVRLHIAI